MDRQCSASPIGVHCRNGRLFRIADVPRSTNQAANPVNSAVLAAERHIRLLISQSMTTRGHGRRRSGRQLARSEACRVNRPLQSPPICFWFAKKARRISPRLRIRHLEREGGARYPMRSTQLSWSSAGRKSRFTDSMIHAPTKIRGNNARTNRKPESSSHPP